MEESPCILNSVLGTTDTSISELKKKINEDAESGLDKRDLKRYYSTPTK